MHDLYVQGCACHLHSDFMDVVGAGYFKDVLIAAGE